MTPCFVRVNISNDLVRGYHEPTKYDVKIRWWTVYYQFGFLDNEQSNAISDLMEVISQKDISGPSCHGYTCDRPTRSNYKHTDFFFETNSPPIASNYQISDSMFKEALMMASSFGISFLFSSQDHFGYQSDSIDFETQYTCIDENEPITKHSKTTAYSYLSTSFRELCSSSEDLSIERWNEIKRLLNKITSENHLLQVKSCRDSKNGKYISSCVNDSKKRKANTTKH